MMALQQSCEFGENSRSATVLVTLCAPLTTPLLKGAGGMAITESTKGRQSYVGTVEIHLANGKGVAIIDAEDADRIISLSGWHLHSCGYAARNVGPAKARRRLLLHRVVMNAQPGLQIDHINHNKLDCRKANLRFATKSQNMQNRRGAERRSISGVRGVSAYQTKTKGTLYRAVVMLNGKNIYRHGFKTLAEAEAAAMELRRTYFTHSKECKRG